MTDKNFDFIAIYEAFSGRSEHLKEMDRIFLKLKKETKRHKLLIELSKKIKDFSNIQSIKIRIQKNELNAAVISRYTSFLPILEKKLETQEGIKIVQEPANNITGIDIILGDKLLDNFTNRELTAIILHELGHVFSHSSYFPIIIKKVTQFLSLLGSGVSFTFIGISPPIMASVLMTCWIVSRTMTLSSHLGEYNADNFAMKYGYGEEIISVLNKFKKINIQQQKENPFIQRIIDFLKLIFYPGSHPADNSRICQIVKTIQKDYENMYPAFKQDITLALSDAKCPY